MGRLSLVLLWAIVSVGCAPRPGTITTFTVAEYESAHEAELAAGGYVSPRPDSEIREADTDNLPAALLDSLSGRDPSLPVFVIRAGSHPSPVFHCVWEMVDRSTFGYFTPGFTTPEGLHIPGTYVPGTIDLQWNHRVTESFWASQIINAGEYVLCRIDAGSELTGSFYVRRPGLESVLDDPTLAPHPGYSPLTGEAWLAVPKDLIRAFGRGGGPQSPEAEPREPEPSGDRFVEKAPISCDDIETRWRAMPEEEQGAVAPLTALCIAADGEDDRALEILDASITTIQAGEMLFDQQLRNHLVARTLVLIAADRVEEAVGSAAAALHLLEYPAEATDLLGLEGPDPTAPLSVFKVAREDDLASSWPRFLEAFAARRAATASASIEPASLR